MGEQNNTQYNDSLTDAVCVLALITIAVATTTLWHTDYYSQTFVLPRVYSQTFVLPRVMTRRAMARLFAMSVNPCEAEVRFTD